MLVRTMTFSMDSNPPPLVEECVVVVKRLVQPRRFKLEGEVLAVLPSKMEIRMVRIRSRPVRTSFSVNTAMLQAQRRTAYPLRVLDFKPVIRPTLMTQSLVDPLHLCCNGIQACYDLGRNSGEVGTPAHSRVECRYHVRDHGNTNLQSHTCYQWCCDFR
jgi:hypothetical protein